MLREFTDKSGVSWKVWDVYPGPARKPAKPMMDFSVFPSRDLTEGWLCFQCDNEKRRLAPIPANWEMLPGDELEELCVRAGFVSKD